MKRISHLLLIAALMFGICTPKVQAQGSYSPPRSYVPDARTAIRIAVAVWSPIYGEKQIQSEKPFRVSLSHGVWTVTGSLPALHGRLTAVGGTALAEISRKDGRILQVFHTK